MSTTTHDEQVSRYVEEYREPATAVDKEAVETLPEAPKSELEELISLLRAHVSFARKSLEFTSGALAEIRKSLAGLDSE
jgi:hypothetical protein